MFTDVICYECRCLLNIVSMFSMVSRVRVSIPIIRIKHAGATSQDKPDVVLLTFPGYVVKYISIAPFIWTQCIEINY